MPIDRSETRRSAFARAVRPAWAHAPGTAAGTASLRRHRVFALIFTAGVILRAITALAYRPVLIFYDSPSYLATAVDLRPDGFRPIGYPLFLAPLIHLDNLAAIPIAQHVMALAAAVLLYATLLRLRLRPWIAAVGTSAFLLDGFQLNIEQWVMSDTLFEVLLIIGFCALLWNRRPGWISCLVCGGALAAAVSVRFVGVFLVLPAIIYTILALPDWKRRLQRTLAICAAFALPIAGYASWFTATNDRFGLSGSSGVLLYARAASFVDCQKVELPDYEKPLCPVEPRGQRQPTNNYAWGPKSPAANYAAPPGMDRDKVLNDFAERVFLAQPFDYAMTVAGDFLHGFQWGRHNRSEDIQEEYWRFTSTYPPWPDAAAAPRLAARFGGGPPSAQQDLAGFLHGYQILAYTNGPFLALALLVALAAGCGLGRSRRSGLRTAALFWAAGGVMVTLLAYAASEFTWRYQMPLVIFYPIAGAIGLFALLGGRRGSTDKTPTDRDGEAIEMSWDGPVCCAGCRPQTPPPNPDRQTGDQSCAGPAVY